MYGQALPLAVTYLREEPDALMSARPGPSGGYHASGIPTGIQLSKYSPAEVRMIAAMMAMARAESVATSRHQSADREKYPVRERTVTPACFGRIAIFRKVSSRIGLEG